MKHYEKVNYLNSAIDNIGSSERSPGGINSRRKGHLKPCSVWTDYEISSLLLTVSTFLGKIQFFGYYFEDPR